MAREQKNHFPVKLRYIVLFVILLALLLAAVGTLAWMRHMRSLQTATLVQVTSLTLVGPDPDTPNSAIVNLGDIDVSEGGSKSYVFGVETESGNKFQIQLAHTTNTPFQYKVYKAKKANSGETPDVPGGISGFIRVAPIDVAYKNETSPGSNLAIQNGNDPFYKGTYKFGDDVYGHVQQNAAPLYWRSDPITQEQGVTITYFILDVTWNGGENNKETDIVYLTVGTAIDTSEGGT